MDDLNYRDLNRHHIIPFRDEISRLSAKITHNLTFGIEDIKLIRLLTKTIETYENLKKFPTSTLEDVIGENAERNIPVARAVSPGMETPAFQAIKQSLPPRSRTPDTPDSGSDSDRERIANVVDLFSLNRNGSDSESEEEEDLEGDQSVKQMKVFGDKMLSHINDTK